MSWLLWKAGGDSWAPSSDSLGPPCSWLLGTATGLLWRWMENSSMMQVTVQPSFSNSLSNVGERWACECPTVPGAVHRRGSRSQILGCALALGLSWLCLLLLCIRAGCTTGLKGAKSGPPWWLCFQEAATFLSVVPLWDGLVKSLVVLTFIILRHFSFRVVNT